MKTHDELVQMASKLLFRGWQWHKACPVVIAEMSSESPENPDAIGFRNGHSIMIECKTCRSDFLADAKKHFRRFDGHCMGNFRYYLAPFDVIKESDLPDGWGLLEDCGHLFRLRKQAVFQKDTDRAYEISLLCSALRRQAGAAVTGVKCRVYQAHGNKTPRASLITDYHAEESHDERQAAEATNGSGGAGA